MSEHNPSEFRLSCEAPEGQTWVCVACGRHSKNRMDVGDESCFLNAVLCYDSEERPWRAVGGSDA